jgi:hypothetical protein
MWGAFGGFGRERSGRVTALSVERSDDADADREILPVYRFDRTIIT